MIKQLSVFAVSLFSFNVFANLHLAPPDFDSNYGRAVFVDFKTAHYGIEYDFEGKIITVKSIISFESTKIGKPIFDLVPSVKSLKINGLSTKFKTIDLPGKVSKVKIIDLNVPPGTHVIEIENEISKNVSFNEEGNRVSNAFWIRDLKDRLFLEQYIPSNLEFDQYQMNFLIKFKSQQKIDQDFFTNGIVTKQGQNSWLIEYPSYFTVSSLYYHTAPRRAFRRMDSVYKSISGREIPITVYTDYIIKTSSFEKYAHEVMKELENDYGEWAHPSLIAYGTLPGLGGMEHSGATQTSWTAVVELEPNRQS